MIVTVSRSYIWAYASFQFAIVILFAHIFYTIVSRTGFFHKLPCNPACVLFFSFKFFVLARATSLSDATSQVWLNMQLNVNPILSVILSSFTGFGIAISTNSLLVEYLRWKASRQLRSSHQHTTTVNELQLQHQQWQHEEQYHRHYQQRRQRLREDSQTQLQQQEQEHHQQQQQQQQQQLNEDPNVNDSLRIDIGRET